MDGSSLYAMEFERNYKLIDFSHQRLVFSRVESEFGCWINRLEVSVELATVPTLSTLPNSGQGFEFL